MLIDTTKSTTIFYYMIKWMGLQLSRRFSLHKIKCVLPFPMPNTSQTRPPCAYRSGAALLPPVSRRRHISVHPEQGASWHHSYDPDSHEYRSERQKRMYNVLIVDDRILYL